jgi:hypothetical protein
MSREVQPVQIEHARDHAFKKWSAKTCWTCRQAKAHPDHHGYVPSLNVLGDGNRFAYRAIKTAWEDRFASLLEQADLPRPLDRVTVEGEITFPDKRQRDQGNHRALLEKALGDALVAGGWLPDDSWERYEFGGLQARYEKGVARTVLMLFPALTSEEEADAA